MWSPSALFMLLLGLVRPRLPGDDPGARLRLYSAQTYGALGVCIVILESVLSTLMAA